MPAKEKTHLAPLSLQFPHCADRRGAGTLACWPSEAQRSGLIAGQVSHWVIPVVRTHPGTCSRERTKTSVGTSAEAAGKSARATYSFAKCFIAAGLMLGIPNMWAQSTVELLSFGTKANDPSVNSRQAFQAALAALAKTGGGTLHIAKGEYYVDFPDVASDIDPAVAANRPLLQARNLTRDKLILVPPHVQLLGDLDASGNPATKIHWKTSGFPIFSFANSDRSSLSNVAFVYDGLQPHFFPWAQEQYLTAIGVNARWLGGPYEISAVIYTIGSEGLRFENLTFASSTNNNEHTFAFGIVSKGKNAVVPPNRAVIAGLPMGGMVPGGGLTACTAGNIYRRLKFSNFVMGILASGQCSPVFENISGDNRGSWFRSFEPTHEPTSGKIVNIASPGHLIYLTFQEVYDIVRTAAHPEGERAFARTVRNTNISLRDISEGSLTLSNFHSYGTLALKNIDGGVIDGVRSQHPAGLIDTLVDGHNLTLKNLSWTSDRDLCSEPDSKQNCYLHAIGIVSAGEPSEQVNDHLTISNVTLKSPRWAAIFEISSSTTGAPLSHDITVDGLRIQCAPRLDAKQKGPKGIITIRAADTHLTNVTYVPVAAGEPAPGTVNYAVLILPDSVRTDVQIGISHVAGVPESSPIYRTVVPAKDGDAIVSHFVN
jgi:hypothetical protein